MLNDRFYARARELTEKLSEEEKLGLLTTHHFEVERLGLPEFYIGTEVARGYVGRDKEHSSTVFPQPIGLASTFDRELMERLGEIAGNEARAYYNAEKRGGLALWGPTVDMVRSPLWGRTEEAYGEDVCLAGQLTSAYTKGMAGENSEGFFKTVPTLKHFCANNNEHNRGSCSAYLTPRLKREYYYAAFEIPIREGGARSIMAAYNELNGLPAIMNEDIQNVLKDEWGLWFVVSDGGDFSQNVMAHRYTATHSEAYKFCLEAGSDTMTDEHSMVRAAAEKALAEGLITWTDIDRSVTNTLYARLRLGQLDETEFDSIDKTIIDTEESRRVNLRAALEQVTLLKNDGLLPLDKSKKLAVLGPLHDDCLMDWYTGCWNYESTIAEGIKREFDSVLTDSLWDIAAVKASNGKYLCAYEDGSVRADADRPEDGALFEIQDWGENWKNLFSVKYQRYIRLFDGGEIKLHNRRIFDWFTRETFNFREYCGKTLIEEFLGHERLCADEDGRLSISKQRGVVSEQEFEIEYVSLGRDRAKKLAEQADAVIYCTGNYPVQTAKECYDRKTLALNVQQGMAQELAKANKNTALVIVSSYPYSVAAESEAVSAVLWTSHAGAELGTAVSKTLTGENNPSGRTPITWYRDVLDLPDIMDYDIESSGATYMYFKGKALYPFGHGLSYSSFEYSDMSVTQTDDGAEITLSVKNTSDKDGAEVVQVYFTVPESSVSRPIKKLCAFERVELKAGEQKRVTLRATEHILSIFDVRSEKMLLEEGEYCFMAGASSEDIRLTERVHLDGERIALRADSFKAAMFERIENAKLFWSKAEHSEYVRVTGWGGKVSYGGVDLAGATRVVFRASSIMGERELTLISGEQKHTVKLLPSDSYDDFKEYSVDLSDASGDTLTFEFGEHTGLLYIRIER